MDRLRRGEKLVACRWRRGLGWSRGIAELESIKRRSQRCAKNRRPPCPPGLQKEVGCVVGGCSAVLSRSSIGATRYGL